MNEEAGGVGRSSRNWSHLLQEPYEKQHHLTRSQLHVDCTGVPFTFSSLCKKRLQKSCTRSTETSSRVNTSCSSSGVWNIARAGSWDFFTWKNDIVRSLLFKLLSTKIKRICIGNRRGNVRKKRNWETENRSPNSDHIKINSDAFFIELEKTYQT